MLDEAEALALSTDRGERSTDGRNSAPSWLDYLDALKVEGRRYMPASMRKALQKREREGCNPVEREGQK